MQEMFTLPDNGGDFQKWRVEGLGNETFKLTNIATGRVLDSNNNGNLYAIEINGGSFQNWKLVRP
jgi:hypothetical protein